MAPLAAIAEVVFGQQSFIILSAIALFSTFYTSLMMLMSGSRLLYGISKERALLKVFSYVSKKTLAPTISIVTVVVIAIFFLFIGDFKSIANLTNFTVFSVFIAVNASLIYLRIKKPVTAGFKVPLNIGKIPILPVLGILTSCFMIINVSINILALGIILVLIGMLVYFIINKFSKKQVENDR